MGCAKNKNIARVRRGSDTLFMLALYRKEGGDLQLGGNQQPDTKLLKPTELESVKAKLILDGYGTVIDDLPLKLTDKHIAFELTKDMAASLGLYRIALAVREVDANYQDGYRDSSVATELCVVVREGEEVTDPKQIDLHLAPLAKGEKGDKGDSAYNVYLSTTSDNPKKTEEEWLDSLTGKTGKSAYQHYLDTTSDETKMSEREWATGGWLVFAELLKRI
nr:MAG TPA: hypothetical protein [Caudoviricetes sp.]